MHRPATQALAPPLWQKRSHGEQRAAACGRRIRQLEEEVHELRVLVGDLENTVALQKHTIDDLKAFVRSLERQAQAILQEGTLNDPPGGAGDPGDGAARDGESTGR